jgi:hypothetical protein
MPKSCDRPIADTRDGFCGAFRPDGAVSGTSVPAVSALKAGADIVLAEADGAGVASFLRGPVLAGRQRVHPRRWRINLGALADGTPASIPASQVNVLVTGVPQRSKSYLAGLISEQLIRLGYSVVILDPEGDHAGLGQLPDVLVTGTGGNLPSAGDLARIVRHHAGGVVVDLSAAPAGQRAGYLEAAPPHQGGGRRAARPPCRTG